MDFPSRHPQAKRHMGQGIPLPRDADEVLALCREDVERLSYEVLIRLGRAKRQREELLEVLPIDGAALGKANGEIAELGTLLGVIHERRAALRRQARQESGQLPELNEAIAIAASRIFHGKKYDRLLREANGIISRAARDLDLE